LAEPPEGIRRSPHRRLSESAEITIIEHGSDVSFANCGLPYHIGGEIQDRSDLAIQTPDSLSKLLNLNVLTNTQAISINRDAKTVAIRAGITIDDLCHLELCYAPPFGSAKDAVNIAGFAACNLRDGLLKPTYGLPETNSQIIDVRPAVKSASQPVSGAKNIPLAQLRSRLSEIDSSQTVFTTSSPPQVPRQIVEPPSG